MKKLLTLAIMLITASAFATGDLSRVSSALQFGGQPVQVFAPETTTLLTVYSTTVDLSNYIMYAVNPLAVATCYMRLMPTSTKSATYIQAQIPASGWTIRAKNYTNPFLNLSGCTAGYLQKQ
jgi:hypothetical protein